MRFGAAQILKESQQSRCRLNRTQRVMTPASDFQQELTAARQSNPQLTQLHVNRGEGISKTETTFFVILKTPIRVLWKTHYGNFPSPRPLA